MIQDKGSVGRTLLIILATIGVFSLILFASCAALIGVGVTSFSKSLMNGSTAKVASGTSAKVSFVTPRKNTPYIAGIKFADEINDEFAENIISKLNYAKNDPNAVAILLDVNSPGGVVVPSQEIYDALNRVAQSKPVVSYVRSVVASGAYYSVAPSTEIIANRGSLIGSLGVIMQAFEVNELLKFLKIQPTTLKTGALKDAGSPFRTMTLDDKNYLKSLIDQIFNLFIEDIKKVRPGISQKNLNFLSDGRVVLAEEAKDLQLIDLVGSKELVKSELARLTKLKTAPDIFYYEDLKPLSDFFKDTFISGSEKVVKEIFVNKHIIPSF